MPQTRSQTAGPRTRSAASKKNKQDTSKAQDVKPKAGTKRSQMNTDTGRKPSIKRAKTEPEYQKTPMKKEDEPEEKPLNGVLKKEDDTGTHKMEEEEPKQVSFKEEIGVHVMTPTEERYQKQHGILERGHVYFFYRPKVDMEEVEDISDVARFSFMLVPRPTKEGPKEENNETKDKSIGGGSAAPEPAPQNNPHKFFRYIVMGKKHLPLASSKREVFWATVADVGDDLKKLNEGLGEQVYQTKTRGQRHKGAARVAGRGVYTIVTPTSASLPPSKLHRTYLAYVLTHPSKPDAIQKALGIESSSSFLLQVKNPEQPSAPGAGLIPEKRAKYSEEEKQEAFGGAGGKGAEARKFGPVNPINLMDYDGTELLIIGDQKAVDDTVGDKGRDQELHDAASDEVESLNTDNVMNELILDAKQFPPNALEGEWV